MNNHRGMWSKKTERTHSGILWVLGERWWTFNTKTVMTMESVTKIMVKSRYSPISGITSEVEGMISVISRRKTVRDRRTEIHNVIFSPQSDGR
ncbi:hypothetical protein GDO81_021279 [Engystomops pustulosus]|uniref:Uncharacterized protein n=1 Tax=Engystomops pustulosus TaxID=76066 RepID=A0AAV6Z6H1_ENGPU|nr:hypothetical protein GDO81_021279 [Engystomops pustulosus]